MILSHRRIPRTTVDQRRTYANPKCIFYAFEQTQYPVTQCFVSIYQVHVKSGLLRILLECLRLTFPLLQTMSLLIHKRL